MGSLAEQLVGFMPEEPERSDPTEAVVRVVLTELDSETDPETLVPDLELEEVGLTGIARWSLVAALERELKQTFVDSEVESWGTLGDILESASH